jgi:hypothetical protein
VPENPTYEVALEDVELSDWDGVTLFDADIINEAAEKLGVQPSELTFQLVDGEGNTDEAYNGNPGETLFWVDLDGNKKNWGNGNKFYIAYDASEPEIYAVQYTCAYDDVLNATVRLAAGEDKYAEFKIQVKIQSEPEIALNYVGEIELEAALKAGVNYDSDGGFIDATTYPERLPKFDVAELAALLGVEDVTGAIIYGVNADSKIMPYGYDGWRDGDGNMANWGTEDGFCVKLTDAASGTLEYVGTVVNTHVAGDSKVARFAITLDDENAVLVTVTVNWVDEEVWTGIDSLIADKSGEQTIYDLSGRRVRTITKGGMYIVNGKKVFVK